MNRSLNFGILVVTLISALAAPRTSHVEAHTANTSAAQVNAYLTHHHFIGYVLLERHGHVILSKGYGLANRAHKVPNTIRTRWLTGGTNRFMTAIAILRLQDEHKLSVQDKLCRYVTACPRAWRPITLHQMLLDTSGLGTPAKSASAKNEAQTMALCRAMKPVAAPGTITPESRCNNFLLNTIIIKVTGKPWTAAMQQLLFGPAHMTDTGRLIHAATTPGLGQGYSSGTPVPQADFSNYYAPYASIQDVERMDRALLSGHLLSKRALHALFRPYIDGPAVRDRIVMGTIAKQLFSGYECYLRKATRTTVLVADKPGAGAGLTFDDALSPDDGSIAIMSRNDDESSGTDPDELLFGFASQLIWGKVPNTAALDPPGRPADV